jgi:DNA polymerase-3 subunit delta'
MNTTNITMSTKVFREIIGQEKAIVFLRRAIANGKIAPAYLFTGIQGIGKATTAMAFALLLNCMEPVDEDGCKQCSSCKKLIDGNHPDLVIIEPDKEKKGIGIDQIRQINRHLAFSPALGPYRIVIIDPAEKMTDEASNAFLKTLEEPPPNNIFILNVRDQRDLLPTIVSRCQKVPFKPLAADQIVTLLEGEGNVDKQKAKIVARLSEGSPGRALKLAGDDFFAARVDWINMLHSVVDEPSDRLLDLAQAYAGSGKRATNNKGLRDDSTAFMLGVWKSWYRDVLSVKLGGTLDLVLNSDLSDHINKASNLYTVDALMRSLAIIARAEYDLMSNKNVLYILERSLLGLKGAFQL